MILTKINISKNQAVIQVKVITIIFMVKINLLNKIKQIKNIQHNSHKIVAFTNKDHNINTIKIPIKNFMKIQKEMKNLKNNNHLKACLNINKMMDLDSKYF